MGTTLKGLHQTGETPGQPSRIAADHLVTRGGAERSPGTTKSYDQKIPEAGF